MMFRRKFRPPGEASSLRGSERPRERSSSSHRITMTSTDPVHMAKSHAHAVQDMSEQACKNLIKEQSDLRAQAQTLSASSDPSNIRRKMTVMRRIRTIDEELVRMRQRAQGIACVMSSFVDKTYIDESTSNPGRVTLHDKQRQAVVGAQYQTATYQTVTYEHTTCPNCAVPMSQSSSFTLVCAMCGIIRQVSTDISMYPSSTTTKPRDTEKTNTTHTKTSTKRKRSHTDSASLTTKKRMYSQSSRQEEYKAFLTQFRVTNEPIPDHVLRIVNEELNNVHYDYTAKVRPPIVGDILRRAGLTLYYPMAVRIAISVQGRVPTLTDDQIERLLEMYEQYCDVVYENTEMWDRRNRVDHSYISRRLCMVLSIPCAKWFRGLRTREVLRREEENFAKACTRNGWPYVRSI